MFSVNFTLFLSLFFFYFFLTKVLCGDEDGSQTVLAMTAFYDCVTSKN